MLPWLFVAAMLVQTAGAAAPSLPADVRHLSLSAPSTLFEIDVESLQGQPARLAWSPDSRQLYLRIARSDIWGNETVRHYIYWIPEKKLTQVEGEPDWSAAYWERKSGLAAPGVADFAIATETRSERKSATNVDGAGSMAQNSGDPSLGALLGPQGGAIIMLGMQSQQVTTTTMRVKGELVAEFVNTRVIRGLTYGWAPSGFGVIAFRNSKKRLALVDASGHKQERAEAKDVFLPAWTDDGARLAYVQRVSKNKFRVQVHEATWDLRGQSAVAR